VKLCILTHAFGGDGSSSMMFDLIGHWRNQRNWEIDIPVPSNIKPEALVQLKQSGANPVQITKAPGAYNFVLINCLSNAAYIDQIPEGIPIILWVHESQAFGQLLEGDLLDWNQRIGRCAAYIFQSVDQQHYFHHLFSSMSLERSHIIPNGVAVDDQRPLKTSILTKTFKIVSVGKVTPLKQQHALSRAVSALASRYDVRCDFIGGLEFVSAFEEAERALIEGTHPNIQWLGELTRQEALAYVDKADLFCLPSKAESFALSPLEAASLGIPVLLANLPVYSEIGWRPMLNCLMFPADRPEQIEVVIESALKNRAHLVKIAANGKALARRYDISHFYQKMDEMIAAIVL
jgi:glycosyltransferase involved in cell wall biosynthesis